MMIVVEELLVMGGIVGLLVVFLVKGSPLSSWRRMRPVWGVVFALASVLGFVALTSDGPSWSGPSAEEQRRAEETKKQQERAGEKAKSAQRMQEILRAAERKRADLDVIVAGYAKLTPTERLAQVAMNCPRMGRCNESELIAIVRSASNEEEKKVLLAAVNRAVNDRDE